MNVSDYCSQKTTVIGVGIGAGGITRAGCKVTTGTHSLSLYSLMLPKLLVLLRLLRTCVLALV